MNRSVSLLNSKLSSPKSFWMHCFVLALHVALQPANPGGKKAFLSPLRPVGHPARVNKQAGGTLLPSGGQWFPSKPIKAAFRCWCRRSHGDASWLHIDHQYLEPLRWSLWDSTFFFFFIYWNYSHKKKSGLLFFVLRVNNLQGEWKKCLCCLWDAAGKVN